MQRDQLSASSSASRTNSGSGYEPTRFARKHGITVPQARELIKKIGNDRDKLNEAALALKREKEL